MGGDPASVRDGNPPYVHLFPDPAGDFRRLQKRGPAALLFAGPRNGTQRHVC